MEFFLLIGVIGAGGLGLMLALAFLIPGLVKKRRESIRTGSLLILLPGLCGGIIYWWYGVEGPRTNRQTQMQVSGTYVAWIPDNPTNAEEIVQNCYQLTLFPDGTYELDNTPEISHWGSGTWETGWIDGQYLLYGPKETIIATGMPSENHINIGQVTFDKSSPCE